MSFLRALKRHSSPIFTVLLFALVFAFGFLAGNQQITTLAQTNPNTDPPANAEENFAAFWEVYNLIDKNYIDDIDPETLFNGAINGMIEALDDQYSGYFDPEMYQFVDADLSGQIEGIGVVIRQDEETGLISVVNVLDDTPAERAGLRVGDIFMVVDGEDVTGLNNLELATRVRGPVGSTVDLTMQRGDELIDFTVERARIDVPNIETEVFDGGIGYVRMQQFTRDVRLQLDQALVEIDARNLNGLIIDLRGNPGGLLSSAVNVASAFIEDGVILYEQFGDGTEQTFNSNGTFTGVDVPIAVLVDASSASASELVAGAWQDQGVATIIGTTTLGKGTVQTQSDLVNGGGVRLTIARWLTPNRNWIHELGVTPDIIIDWTLEEQEANPDFDPQLEAALEFLRTGDVSGASE